MNRRSVLSLSLIAAAGTAGLAGCGGRSGGSGGTTIRLGDDDAEDNPEIAAERYFGDQVKYRGTFGDLMNLLPAA